MFNRVIVLVGLVSWAAAGAALAEPAMEPALAELLNKDPKNRAIPESDKPGAPVAAVIGELATGSPQAMETTAREFIKAHGKAFGFPENTGLDGELAQLAPRTTDGGTTLSWVPTQNKVPYLKGALSFSFTPDGKLTGVSGRYRKLTGVTMGSIDAGQAVKKALAEARRTKKGKLMTGDGVAREYLADVDGGGIQHQFTVDLVVGTAPRGVRVVMGPSGNTLRVEGGESKGVVNARVNPDYEGVTDPDVPTKIEDLKEIKQISWYEWYKIEGPAFKSESTYSEKASAFFRDGFRDEPYMMGPQSEGDRLLRKPKDKLANPLFLEANVYFHLMKVHDEAAKWGIEVDKKPGLKYDVWSQRKKDNAAFMHSDWSFVFARNNKPANRHPGMDPTLIYHEYGHYLHRTMQENYDDGGDLKAQREASAVGEGWSDVVAAWVTGSPKIMQIWFGGTPDRDLGGDIATAKKYEDVTPPWIWDTDPANPDGDEIHSPPDGKEPIHKAGQLFSGACWEMRTALGAEPAIKLVVEGLKRTAPPHTFKAVAAGIMLADGGKNTDKLTPIFTKRGLIGAPVAAPPAPASPAPSPSPAGP